MDKELLNQTGLKEKMDNAKKLRLINLAKIGINSEEELESIIHDEKFSIKNRLAKLAKTKNVSLNEMSSNELEPIPENEKCEKFKAYEQLTRELYSKNNLSTLSDSSKGIYVINRSGRTLYTASGQPLYHKEVCVKFPLGGKIYMMRTNGTMGYEYLNSTDSSDSNFRTFKDMVWIHNVPYYALLCRGSKVDLHYYDGSYFGYIDYEDSVSDRYGTPPLYSAANSNHLLMSIYGYSVYGQYHSFNGFVHTKLNIATGMDNLAVYGDPSRL